MTRLVSLALLVALFAGGGASAQSPAKAPPPAKPVDAARLYTGTWREIGRRPMKITDGCVAGATTYRMVDPTHVEVRDTCRQGDPAGKEKAIGGPAHILDPGTNTKLRVDYRLLGIIPVTREYDVLDHAEDYSWFISSDPRFQNLWIYTRDPRVDPAMLKSLVERARALGYDVSKLEFPAQP